ncbi:MAG TPA: exosortase H [Acidobacteriota bacterium]|jgi:exosortase H (IPTLxxWG-CTERM-specific)
MMRRRKKTVLGNPTFKFLGLFFAYVLLAGFLIRLDWVDRRLMHPYTVLITRISGAILNAMGILVETLGTTIRHNSFAVDIRRGCDGVVATAVLVSACLAYPLRWKARVLGALSGYALIFVLNLIRVMGLFYVGLKGSSRTFEFFHIYVSQFAVIALAMVFWIYWVGREKTAVL